MTSKGVTRALRMILRLATVNDVVGVVAEVRAFALPAFHR